MGGLPRHNNAKTHFHGIPHGMMSMTGETTDFLCKEFFFFLGRGGKEATDSFIANDFSVLLGGGGHSDAGACITASDMRHRF